MASSSGMHTSYSVQFPLEKIVLILGRQVVGRRDVNIGIPSNKMEEVLLKVGTRARNRSDMTGTNHLGKATANLGRTHGTGEGGEDGPAFFDMINQRGGCSAKRTRVEVAIVFVHEGSNRHRSSLRKEPVNTLSAYTLDGGHSLEQSVMEVGGDTVRIGRSAGETIDGQQSSVGVAMSRDVAFVNQHNSGKAWW